MSTPDRRSENASGTPMFPSVSPAEYRRRYEVIWKGMEEQGVDALVVYGDSSSSGGNSANTMYLTGYRDPLFNYVLLKVGEEPRVVISNPLYLPHARAMADVSSVEALSWEPGKHLAETLKGMGVANGRIGLTGVQGIQRSTLPHEHVRTMTELLPRATFTDTTLLLQGARRIKSAEEIEMIRIGSRLTDGTMEALARDARIGMTEYELAGIVYGAGYGGGGDQRLMFLGSTSMASPEIVFPRQSPSHRRLQDGDIVLTEFSTGWGGYSGQIHRALVAGEPTAEYQRLFDVAKEIFDRSFEVLGPGQTADDLRAAASPIIRQANVWTMDALAHGWGLSIEAPRLDVTETATIQRPQEPIVFQPGMVMVLQPHVLSQDQQRGLQLGSLVVITDDGVEALQKFPMEWVHVSK